jgi:hypothetical protein
MTGSKKICLREFESEMVEGISGAGTDADLAIVRILDLFPRPFFIKDLHPS